MSDIIIVMKDSTTIVSSAAQGAAGGQGVQGIPGIQGPAGTGFADGNYGDIAISGGVTALTINPRAVTYAKMQNVSATDVVLGRSSIGAGSVEEIACTATGRSVIASASALAARAVLGLVIGSDVAPEVHGHAWSDISATPTTLGGYGITDAYTKTASDARFAPIAVPWASITGTPTTLSGYGITDAYTKTASDARFAPIAVPWASITGTPTTLAGYGITDAQPLDADLTAIAAFVGTGIPARTAANTWAQRSIAGTASRIAVTNGNGVSGNPTVDIDAGYVGQASITTLGTIGTGVWNAGAVTSSGAVQGTQLVSAVAIGTAPLTVTSTTLVANLYAAQSALADTVTTNANLTGPITSTGNATAVASQTGTGSTFVMDTSPTISFLSLSGFCSVANAAGFQWKESTNSAFRGFVWYDSGNLLRIENFNRSDIVFNVGSIGDPVEAMRITSIGNVGIGTNNPLVPLVVKNAQTTGTATDNLEAQFVSANRSATLAIDAISTASANFVFRAGGSERGRVSYLNSSDALLFNTAAGGVAGAGERMRIDSTGRVGIGRTPTASLLEVAGGIVSSSATSGFGYMTGAGGTVAQATSKTTAVTLNAMCGTITTVSAALAAGASATFTLNSTGLALGDIIVCVHDSAGTLGAYTMQGRGTGAGVGTITVRNVSSGSLTEAPVIRFSIIKAVTA